MAKKVLSIIESAYRAVAEEQDDTIVWITTAMQKAGGQFTVLLQGNAVNYLLTNQNAPALKFGNWEQTNPPSISTDMSRLKSAGVEILYVEEDVAERGLLPSEMMSEAKGISLSGVAKLMQEHDLVWMW